MITDNNYDKQRQKELMRCTKKRLVDLLMIQMNENLIHASNNQRCIELLEDQLKILQSKGETIEKLMKSIDQLKEIIENKDEELEGIRNICLRVN